MEERFRQIGTPVPGSAGKRDTALNRPGLDRLQQGQLQVQVVGYPLPGKLDERHQTRLGEVTGDVGERIAEERAGFRVGLQMMQEERCGSR